MSVKTPRYLHKPMNFIICETDDLMVGYVTFIIMIITNLPTPIIFTVTVIIMAIYRNRKKKHNRGFLKHIGYMTGINKFKGFVSSKFKKFRE